MNFKNVVSVLGLSLIASISTAYADQEHWHEHIVTGAKAYEQAKFDEALAEFQKALKEAESFGPNDLRVAIASNQIGLVYLQQGKYDQAEAILQKTLAAREKSLGHQHSDCASTLHDLAKAYCAQGKNDQAEQALRQALAIRQKVNGVKSVEVASTLEDLAGVCEIQNKKAEAEKFCQEAMTILKTKGSTPELATVLNRYATMCTAHDKIHHNAEAMYKEALAIDEKVFGADHPAVARDLNNLAGFYTQKGKYKEADSFCKRALEIRQKAFGENSPEVTESLRNCAVLEKKLGKAEAAAK